MIFKRQKTLLTKKQAKEMAKVLRKALEEAAKEIDTAINRSEEEKEFLNKLLFFTEENEETRKIEIYPADGQKIACGVKEAKILIGVLENFIQKSQSK